MTLSLQCITVDAHNPKAQAEFWAEVLGWSIGEDCNEVEQWIERELGDPKQTGFPDSSGFKGGQESTSFRSSP